MTYTQNTKERPTLKRRLSSSYGNGSSLPTESFAPNGSMLPSLMFGAGVDADFPGYEGPLESSTQDFFFPDEMPCPGDGYEATLAFVPSITDGKSAGRLTHKRGVDEFENGEVFQGYDLADSAFQIQPEATGLDQQFVHTDSSSLYELPIHEQTQPPKYATEEDARHQSSLTLTNPFIEVASRRHERLKAPRTLPTTVNSYLKFTTVSAADPGRRDSQSPLVPVSTSSRSIYTPNRSDSHYRQVQTRLQDRRLLIPHQPPGHGLKFPLGKIDRAIWSFYQTALCSGRTLLKEDNGWLNQLMPMADSDLMAHHALLAFGAGYALEYRPTPELLELANEHYREASALLSDRLSRPIPTGGEDVLVGTFRLMWADDIVQWELRRPKHALPRWYEAVRAAKRIMKATDTGHRYWKQENVQYNKSRISNANMLAFIDTMAMNVTPLDPQNFEPHPWLLSGTIEDSEKIHGATGLSPKVLYRFAQITDYCGLMMQDSQSKVFPLAARRLEDELSNLRQWSTEVSRLEVNRHASVEKLLERCHLDANGYATRVFDVVDLGGEAWLQAARIYLQFRFFRLPRTHSDVQGPYNLLKQIIRRLPCSGPLFTSQSPLFPIFLLGIAAVTEEDRQIVRNWFDTVVLRSSVRSSVPPLWKALQGTWTRLDEDEVFQDDEHVDQKPIGERKAWWELLVEHWQAEVGTMCIV